MSDYNIGAAAISIGASLVTACAIHFYWEWIVSLANKTVDRFSYVHKSELLQANLSLENAMQALGEARTCASTNYHIARHLRLRVMTLETCAEDTQPQILAAKDSLQWLELFVRDMGDAASRCDRLCQTFASTNNEKEASHFSGKAEAYEAAYFRSRRHLSALKKVSNV